MYNMEYFEVFLNSADANQGKTTPHTTIFNLGSINDFVPNSHLYQNADYCYVKVKYFVVEETLANFNTANVGTILIEMGSAMPNSVRSEEISTSNPRNMTQSNIIGLVPTSIGSNTYSSTRYENDFVKAGNILNGDIVINLKNQDNLSLTLTASKAWVMLLCIGFEKQAQLKNKSNIDYF